MKHYRHPALLPLPSRTQYRNRRKRPARIAPDLAFTLAACAVGAVLLVIRLCIEIAGR